MMLPPVSVSLLVVLVASIVVAAIVGTERLGRPLTDDEKRRFGQLLREHDYPNVRLVALRFAHKLTRARVRAQDLMDRADMRLVRFGWDPDVVLLATHLCRLVWSEWMNEKSETATARRAAEGFLRELHVTEGIAIPSMEKRATELEAQHAAQEHARACLAKLRASFEAAGDDVNLLFLDYAIEGMDLADVKAMAERSGRDVSEFYRARDRRRRHVMRLLAAERGVVWEEDK
jgi:hypothetical protein